MSDPRHTLESWFAHVRSSLRPDRAPRGVHAGLSAVESSVTELFREDSASYSFIFEPSLAWHAGASALLYRFSYAWPEYRLRPCAVRDAVRRMIRPLGSRYDRWFSQTMRLLSMPGVEQPLAGLEVTAQFRFRLKFYIQFRPEFVRSKHAILNALGFRVSPDHVASLSPLHLIGIDYQASGITGVKLYTRFPRIDFCNLSARVRQSPMVDCLQAQGFKGLKDFLLITRLDRPCDIFDIPPSEMDFSLRRNGIDWTRLRTFLTSSGKGGTLDPAPYDALKDRFRILENRISLPLAGMTRANLYYLVLDTL